MAFQVSPGVNVSEIDLTTIVPAVATSLGAIAGCYEWGPARRVVLVDTPRNYRRIFGDPKNWNYVQWFSGANFLGYSNSLQVVRVVDENAKNSVGAFLSDGLTEGDVDNGLGITSVDNELFENEDYFEESNFNGVFARYPGEKGNSLKVAIFAGAGDESGFDITLGSDISSTAFSQGDTVYVMTNFSADKTISDPEAGVSGVTATGEVYKFEDSVLTIRGIDGNWEDIGTSAGTTTVFVNVYQPGASLTSEYAGSIDSLTGATITKFSQWKTNDGTVDYSSYFGYDGEGAPEGTDNVIALAGATSNDQIHLIVVDEDGKFTGSRNTILERYENVSVLPEARAVDGTVTFYKNYINSRSQYIYIGGPDTPDDPKSDFVTQTGLSFGLENYVVDWGRDGINGTKVRPGGGVEFSLTGGIGQTTGTEASNYTSNLISQVPAADPKGYNLFEDTELYDVNLLISGGANDKTSVGYLRALAEARKDCVVFVSAENKNEFEGEQVKINNCKTMKERVGSSSYVVIDTGYKYQYDFYNDLYRWVPMNADIAGLCARTDYNNDPWFSPAGYNRGSIRNAIKIAFNPTKAARDEIYPDGVNPIVSNPGEGTLLLGDKTALSKPSAFDRINVRRLFIVLEKAIATASKFSLFEFNDDVTRSRFVSLVTPFLNDVKSRRGIIDFKVVCDASNNTAERIDRNEFWADIYVKPNRSINFIQLNFIATRSDSSFNEFGA